MVCSRCISEFQPVSDNELKHPLRNVKMQTAAWTNQDGKKCADCVSKQNKYLKETTRSRNQEIRRNSQDLQGNSIAQQHDKTRQFGKWFKIIGESQANDLQHNTEFLSVLGKNLPAAIIGSNNEPKTVIQLNKKNFVCNPTVKNILLV